MAIRQRQGRVDGHIGRLARAMMRATLLAATVAGLIAAAPAQADETDLMRRIEAQDQLINDQNARIESLEQARRPSMVAAVPQNLKSLLSIRPHFPQPCPEIAHGNTVERIDDFRRTLMTVAT